MQPLAANDMTYLTPDNRGRFFAVLALFSGVFSGVLIKSSGSIPPPEAIMIRSAIAVVLLGCVVALRAARRSGGKFGLHGLARAVLDAAAGLTYSLAIFQLPLATLATIHAILPILSTFLSAVLLREALRRRVWVALALGLAGTAIIMRPGPEVTTLGLILAVASTFGYATRDVVTRLMPANNDPFKSVLVSVIIVLCGATALASGTSWNTPAPVDLAMLAVAAATLLAASTFIMRALKIVPIGMVAPLRYTSILWSLLFDALVWHVTPPPVAWGGIGLIVLAGFVLNWPSRKRTT